MRLALILLCFASCLPLAAQAGGAAGDPPRAAGPAASPQSRPARLLVTFAPGVTADEARSLLDGLAAREGAEVTVLRDYPTLGEALGGTLFLVGSSLPEDVLRDLLIADPRVERAEPDQPRSVPRPPGPVR